jgi:hypothetical protein
MINEEVQYEKTLSLIDTPKLVHRSAKDFVFFQRLKRCVLSFFKGASCLSLSESRASSCHSPD